MWDGWVLTVLRLMNSRAAISGFGQAIRGQADDLDLGRGVAGPARGRSAAGGAGTAGVRHGLVEREGGTLGPCGGETLVAELRSQRCDRRANGDIMDHNVRSARPGPPTMTQNRCLDRRRAPIGSA
jgi:hypothetical protein